MRPHRDRTNDSRAATPRWTTLDGTPCDLPTLRRDLDRLAERLRTEPLQELGTPVDLATLERHILREHGRELRDYARAWRRSEQFEQQLAALKAGGPRPTYYAPDTRRRARGDAKNGRGYAWVRNELKAELRKAQPRLRRADTLQSKVVNSVRDFVDGHVLDDRGVPALVNRLTAAYLRLQFPTLCKDITADRIRRRSSVRRAKP